MNTPEQQALQLAAQAWCAPATSGLEMDVNLATAVAEKFAPIIAENAALKAELAAIKGAGEPVAWLFKAHKPGKHVVCAGLTQEAVGLWPLDQWDYVEETPLYTRPCVPLTDEQIVSIRDEHLPSQGDSFDCVAFARAVEAHIKGAKG